MRQTRSFNSTRCRAWAVVVAAAVLAACTSAHESPDFHRHRLSQLAEPFDRKDVLYFDVTLDPAYPDNDPVAEATRMQWLSVWLEKRKMCPAGFDIVERRPFDMLEHNPARHDIRYEVKCRTGPAP